MVKARKLTPSTLLNHKGFKDCVICIKVVRWVADAFFLVMKEAKGGSVNHGATPFSFDPMTLAFCAGTVKILRVYDSKSNKCKMSIFVSLLGPV